MSSFLKTKNDKSITIKECKDAIKENKINELSLSVPQKRFLSCVASLNR